MASPTEVTVFGGYFPMALRYSLDVPALFNQYGLKADLGRGIRQGRGQHISAGSWDPCNFSTNKPIKSWPTCRACASSPSRPRAASCRSSAWCR
jgi:hypothetical protein